MGRKGNAKGKKGKQEGTGGGKRKRGGGAVVGGGIGGSAVSWFGAENDDAHESSVQKQQLRHKLKVRQLTRKLETQEKELRKHLITPEAPKPVKKKGRLPLAEAAKTWKLRGAARPAPTYTIDGDVIYPDGDERNIDWHALGPPTEDLVEVWGGRFSEGPPELCGSYLEALLELAVACRDAGMSGRACEHLRRACELDCVDASGARFLLVLCYVDNGLVDEAGELMDVWKAGGPPVRKPLADDTEDSDSDSDGDGGGDGGGGASAAASSGPKDPYASGGSGSSRDKMLYDRAMAAAAAKAGGAPAAAGGAAETSDDDSYGSDSSADEAEAEAEAEAAAEAAAELDGSEDDDDDDDEDVEAVEDDEGEGTIFAYCRAIIAFVSWAVLKEDGASSEAAAAALDTAHAANPFILAWVAYHEEFVDVVDTDGLYDQEAEPGSLEEAFIFCADHLGPWLDTEGVRDWAREGLARLGVQEPGPGTDESFKAMYETALELVGDNAEGRQDQDQSAAERAAWD